MPWLIELLTDPPMLTLACETLCITALILSKVLKKENSYDIFLFNRRDNRGLAEEAEKNSISFPSLLSLSIL